MEHVLALNILDLFVNLQQFLREAIAEYHSWVYLILFLILFCETGLVITPVLPGDSLLFMAGAFAAETANGPGPLELRLLLGILILGPILGDSTNYWLGRYLGPKVWHKENVRFLNRDYLDRAHQFYEKHGGKAVVIGRFLPIIRTFVPFVAGVGKMPYVRFLVFSVLGTVAWISICVLAGYKFGQSEFVQKHFELVIIAIVVISMLPAVIGYLRHRPKRG